MELKVESLLRKIDTIIIQKTNEIPFGLLDGKGGCSLYLAYRYIQTGNENNFHYANLFLEQTIEDINNYTKQEYLCLDNTLASACWLINHYANIGVFDTNEKYHTSQIINCIIKSDTKDDFKNNRHDLFYGFIGRAILLMEYDIEMAKPFVLQAIDSLKRNKTTTKEGTFWTSFYPFYESNINAKKIINFGIPHGMTGIILFLLKLTKQYNLKNEMAAVIKDSVKWLANCLKTHRNHLPLAFGEKKLSTKGMLGWCYGDLTVIYVLLRYQETFQDNTYESLTFSLIKQSDSIPLLDHMKKKYRMDLKVYDTCICHGAGSIAYMYHKFYLITKNETVSDIADRWYEFLIKSVSSQSNSIDRLVQISGLSGSKQLSFLNGIAGAGLALMACKDEKLGYWDSLLLLDR
jgi:hypothetical protein